MSKKVLITGISGQDGSFLTEHLLSEGVEVHGMVRRWSGGAPLNLKHLLLNDLVYRKRLFLHSGDLSDGSSMERIFKEVWPDELYNLGAMADVAESFLQPEYSIDVNGTAVLRWLEIIKRTKPDTRFYQASTSELFGNALPPQNESTSLNPNSPYALGKFVGYQAVRNYREAHGLFACNGVLFNHESERRGEDFLTRKVTRAVSRISQGLQKELRLGNLDAKRDWGYSKEYVKAMHLMLQQEKPDDYCVGTGEQHSVLEWVVACFDYVGLDWNNYVVIDKRLFRAQEVDDLLCDNRKAKEALGWKPGVTFKKLVQIMMDADLKALEEKYEIPSF